MAKKLLRYLTNIGLISFGLYILVCLLLYVCQDSLLFHPQPKSIPETSAFLQQQPNFDTLCLVMEDKTRVSVLLSKHDSAAFKHPLVIYFGGNAEEVSHLAEYKDYVKPCIMALVNNRGFGRSAGHPSEKSMFSDALEVYDRLSKRPDIDPEKIFVMGRSIGSGVATYLSSKRPVKATVLITPYESMIAVAQEKYPIVPIALLIKHPFESKNYAKDIATPVLALIAKNDVVIPPPHAYALLKSWKGKTFFLEANADHNSIISDAVVWKRIKGFIAENSR